MEFVDQREGRNNAVCRVRVSGENLYESGVGAIQNAEIAALYFHLIVDPLRAANQTGRFVVENASLFAARRSDVARGVRRRQ